MSNLRAKLNQFLGDLFREESFGAGEEEPRDYSAEGAIFGFSTDGAGAQNTRRHLTLVRDELPSIGPDTGVDEY